MHIAIRKASIAAVAAVALLATMAEASSSGDSSSETTTSSAAAEGTGTTESAPADEAAGPGIGDEARDGKFAFTVSKIKCGVNKVGN